MPKGWLTRCTTESGCCCLQMMSELCVGFNGLFTFHNCSFALVIVFFWQYIKISEANATICYLDNDANTTIATYLDYG